MPHRSFPPSHYRALAVPAGVILTMARHLTSSPASSLSGPLTASAARPMPTNPVHSAQPRAQLERGVYLMPAPLGMTRIVGITTTGEWVAEYLCQTADFTEQHIVAMERTVQKKERAQLQIVR